MSMHENSFYKWAQLEMLSMITILIIFSIYLKYQSMHSQNLITKTNISLYQYNSKTH